MECRIVDLQDLAYGFLDPDSAARVRDHLSECARCRADFARLTAERTRLAGAASGLAAPRERKNLLPLAFAAALLVGLLWLLVPRESSPAREAAPADVVAVPASQDKKGSKEVADDEESLQKEIARLDAALKNASDDQERARIKTSIGDLKIRLQRAIRAKSDPTAMKDKDVEPRKPNVKGKTDADDRVLKLKMELKGLSEKIKLSTDPAEKQRLEPRVREIEQELKLLEPTPKTAVNFKEADLRLQSNPDDVGALVDRATWFLDNGKAEPAMKDLERAIAIKPDCAPAYLKRAIAHAMMGHQPEAWADVKRGEQLDMKAGKMIDETLRTIKKLTGSKGERKQTAGDLENQIGTLRDRLEELRSMAANPDLGAADRERAGRDADRVQAEIDRMSADLKTRPAEPEKKVEKKK